jgi:hypothetical protein
LPNRLIQVKYPAVTNSESFRIERDGRAGAGEDIALRVEHLLERNLHGDGQLLEAAAAPIAVGTRKRSLDEYAVVRAQEPDLAADVAQNRTFVIYEHAVIDFVDAC